jgi:hypothetical protein
MSCLSSARNRAFLRVMRPLLERGAQGVVHGDHADVFAGLHDAGSMKVLPSRMQAETAGVLTRSSRARARPLPSALGTSCWEMMPRSDSLTMMRIWSRWSVGKTSSTRSRVRGGVAGVQGAEHQVTGFRGGDGERDGFEVAHFPDHDDIGVFAQGGAQGGGEGLSVWLWTSRWFTWQPWIR